MAVGATHLALFWVDGQAGDAIKRGCKDGGGTGAEPVPELPESIMLSAWMLVPLLPRFMTSTLVRRCMVKQVRRVSTTTFLLHCRFVSQGCPLAAAMFVTLCASNLACLLLANRALESAPLCPLAFVAQPLIVL